MENNINHLDLLTFICKFKINVSHSNRSLTTMKQEHSLHSRSPTPAPQKTNLSPIFLSFIPVTSSLCFNVPFSLNLMSAQLLTFIQLIYTQTLETQVRARKIMNNRLYYSITYLWDLISIQTIMMATRNAKRTSYELIQPNPLFHTSCFIHHL